MNPHYFISKLWCCVVC